MMTVCTRITHLLVLICMFCLASCGHRHSGTPTAVHTAAVPEPISPRRDTIYPPISSPIIASVVSSTKTYRCPTADIQFDYPADWQPNKAQTAVFAIQSPACLASGRCSLNLDIPRLPWHLQGMITVSMVASGYENDLKKNQMHDAKREEDCPLRIPGAVARRIISCGHDQGRTLVDMAIILIHADRVYILSTDSDAQGCDIARKTLDEAFASLKWTK